MLELDIEALQANLEAAESAVADLDARADEAAVAAKMEVVLDDLYGSVGSLIGDMDGLCARVNDISAALEDANIRFRLRLRLLMSRHGEGGTTGR